MKDQSKTKQVLIQELVCLRQRIAELEQSETARKRAAEELKARNELFSLYMDRSPIYTFIKEVTPTRSIVLHASDNYRDIIGIPGSVMVGKTMEELFPPEFAAKITGDDWAVASRGEILRFDEELNGRSYTTIKFPITQSDRTLLAGYAIDITGRKQTEYALSESEKHYRTLFNAIDEGFCIIEVIFDENEKPIDYRFLEINPSFEKQTGLIDAQGKRMRELAPKHEEHWFEIYGKIALTGQPVRFVHRAEQLHRWYDVYAFRVGQPENRQVAILFNDITERKRLEEVLQESEERFRKLFESLPQLVWTCQPDGLCDFLSPQWVKYTGIPEVTQLGFGWLKQLHPDDREPTMAVWSSACDSGSDFHVKFRIRRYDGVYHWFYTHALLLRGHDGRPTKWFGSNTDINDLTQAEEALRESRQLLRIVLNNAPITMFATDDQGTFILSEGKNLEKVNLKPGENVGASALDLFGTLPVIQLNGDKLNGREVIRRVLAGETLTGITELRDNYFENQFVPYYDLHDKVIGMIGIATIITERIRAEKELRTSREQMRALARRLQTAREEERTNIARMIHDELGGALTGLRIDLSFLARAVSTIESMTVRTSVLTVIDSMVKTIDTTIQNVRRIAMELRPGVLDDLGLVAALEWQLNDFQKRTGIRCEFFPPVEDISLDADLSTALFRILQEALTNVARHSGATEVYVRLNADAASCTLEIEDNGKGMEKEKIDSSNSLGLLGMRERAQMFGGRIIITGTHGTGTTVTVDIPSVEKGKMDRDQGGAAG